MPKRNFYLKWREYLNLFIVDEESLLRTNPLEVEGWFTSKGDPTWLSYCGTLSYIFCSLNMG
jgi:hypothetical protein